MKQPVTLRCTRATYVSQCLENVRWLDWDDDYEVASKLWPVEWPLTRDIWSEARDMDYEYAGAFVKGDIVSIAAVWRYSDSVWETAAVRTLPAYQCKGYATQVIAFITKHILDEGREATCHTAEDNFPMRRTAEKVGFYVDEKGQTCG